MRLVDFLVLFEFIGQGTARHAMGLLIESGLVYLLSQLVVLFILRHTLPYAS